MFGTIEIIQNIIYFISLYYVVFWLLVLIDSEDIPRRKIKEWPSITIIIPAYNEEENIIKTIKSVESLDYPKDKISLIVVDDGSSDNTFSLSKEYCSKIKGFKDIVVMTQKNKGKYAAMNNALKIVNTEYFATLDADSFPKSNSLKKIISLFNSEDIAAVSPVLKVYRPRNYVQFVQWFEYSVNHFYKSVITRLNAIHVTPGPLSVYRSDVIKKIGGFREAYKTEDMEIAMRIQKNNYRIVQCDDAFVYTKAPYTIKSLYTQRLRWNYGTFKNLLDYRKMILNKKYGDFGLFQLPIILISGILGITIIFLIVYDFIKRMKPTFRMLELYNFNIIEYLANTKINIIWLDIDVRSVVTFLVFLVLTLIVIRFSMQIYREKYPFKRSFSFILYLMYYYIFLAIVWLGVFKEYLLGRDNKWKK
ncbi:MAG: glucosaminyltransferase [Candidatus Woesearchaeota archaeon]|nr:MAG: glucosaminyltransferase [Candidatus Woesearchaeota archaeon]